GIARNLGLELPTRPVKGQLLLADCRVPPVGMPLFAGEALLVPRPEGQLVVGVTVEEAGCDEQVTLGGLRHLLQGACALAPAVAQLPLGRAWAGLRPATAEACRTWGRCRRCATCGSARATSARASCWPRSAPACWLGPSSPVGWTGSCSPSRRLATWAGEALGDPGRSRAAVLLRPRRPTSAGERKSTGVRGAWRGQGLGRGYAVRVTAGGQSSSGSCRVPQQPARRRQPGGAQAGGES